MNSVYTTRNLTAQDRILIYLHRKKGATATWNELAAAADVVEQHLTNKIQDMYTNGLLSATGYLYKPTSKASSFGLTENGAKFADAVATLTDPASTQKIIDDVKRRLTREIRHLDDSIAYAQESIRSKRADKKAIRETIKAL